MNSEELTGRARSHIIEVADGECELHVHAVTPFARLRRAARADGIDLVAISSFRDFDRQLNIWNGKFSGTRALLDAAGARIEAASMTPRERVAAILLWSALPGASRHHWGTDVDLIDRAAMPAGYRPQLTQAEFAAGGPFAALGEWLETNAPRFGFFRPFRGVRSGVQPEPWHFSFAPIAEGARRSLSPPVLRSAIEGSSLLGKEPVLEQLDALHHRFVASIDLP